MRVGEAVIDLLVRHYGLDTVFGIPGVHNIELFRGMHRSGVRLVSPRHEQGAGFMADAWSVVTGRPGVACVISGPGLTNTLTPMAQAFHDSRPMLVLASTTPTDALGRRFGPLHDLDDQALVARSVCAISETVTDPTQVPGLLARAWEVFTSGRPRPVHLAFPLDVLAREVEPFEPEPARGRRPVAPTDQIAAAATVLEGSRRPVIVAGGGTIDAGAALAELAERLDAPVLATNNAKGVLATSHPLCANSCLWRPQGHRAIEEADVLLMVGTELGDADLDIGGRDLNLPSTIVRIDIDPDQLTRRASPTVAMVGDAGPSMAALAAALQPGVDRRGAERTAALVAAWRADTRSDLVPWLTVLDESLTDDTIVALDSTQLGYAAQAWLRCERTRSWLAPYGYGTLGCALPMAIGAAVAAPGRPVLAVAGDGGWLFTVAEMAVAADLGLDVVLVLWDNRGYGQIHQSFVDVDATPMGVDVSSHDPTAIARGFGWTADDVDTPAQLADRLRTARAQGGPHMIRVAVA